MVSFEKEEEEETRNKTKQKNVKIRTCHRYEIHNYRVKQMV